MRILHVITSLEAGGAEKLMVDLLPKIKSSAIDKRVNIDLELLVFDGTKTGFYEQLKKSGIVIHHFGVGRNVYNPWLIVKLMGFIRKYDIIHAHNTPCQVFVAIANLFFHKTIVTTEHSSSNRRRGKKYLWFFDNWLYHQFKYIVCVSEVAAHNVCEYVKDPSLPIKIVVNGIDVKRYAQACPSMEIDTANFNSIMVAGFRYEKDQKTVIRAHAMLPDYFHLYLIGDGVERKSCELLVSDLHLSNKVHFLGVRMDVPNLLKAADIVIMSSHGEGFGLSAVEGMAAIKPLIASDVDGLHDIVKDYGILFPHEDYESLAREILAFYDDKLYSSTVGMKCYEKAVQFDISKTADSYLELYTSCSVVK